VAGLCGLDIEARAQLMAKVKVLASDGLRVLAVAKAEFNGAVLPAEQTEFNFQYVGLAGLADPVRPTVRGSVKECRHAGIKVVMITGDYPETARHIACEIGLENCQDIITGAELERMSEKELREKIKTANIFARIVPEQKMLLVNAFKANGEIVAMTGDGVNDAPALKAAHIGVAMGGRGTDVAREASDLVLLDDDFTSIVRAVRSGRRIFDNMREAVAFIISVHIPIAGIALLPVLFNWPLVLLPVHIVFLELIIDPACSLVFEAEPEAANIMDRPPRKVSDSLFSRRMVGFGLAQGFLVLISVLAVLVIAWYRGLGEEEARALTFASMVMAYLALILTNISWHKKLSHIFVYKNTALWYVLGGATAFLLLAIYLPALRNVFHFSSLGFFDLLIALAVGLFNVLFFKLIKIVRKLRKAV
jgi:Ca2+-transporting ATPase